MDWVVPEPRQHSAFTCLLQSIIEPRVERTKNSNYAYWQRHWAFYYYIHKTLGSINFHQWNFYDEYIYKINCMRCAWRWAVPVCVCVRERWRRWRWQCARTCSLNVFLLGCSSSILFTSTSFSFSFFICECDAWIFWLLFRTKELLIYDCMWSFRIYRVWCSFAGALSRSV